MIQKAILCLALNIYHEARGEPKEGQIAVAMVTMNRAEWETEKVCDAVYKKHQFSWTKKQEYTPTEPNAWKKAQVIAKNVISGKHKDCTKGATHFHSTSVHPKWKRSFQKTARIGQHVFYLQRP